jgi:hypothetical protein
LFLLVECRFGGVEDEIEEVAKIQGISVDRYVSFMQLFVKYCHRTATNFLQSKDCGASERKRRDIELDEGMLDIILDLALQSRLIVFSSSVKENLRQRIIQDVIRTVVGSDRDGDMKFDRVEAKFLALKIKVKLEVYGIYFDEEKFLQAIALRPSFAGAIAVIKKLLPVEYQDEKNIDDTTRARSCSSSRFDDDDSLDEDDLYDMFYMTKGEQEQRESVMAVRAVFGAAPARRISLASHSPEPRRSSLARSRLTSSCDEDVIRGGGNMFPVIEE